MTPILEFLAYKQPICKFAPVLPTHPPFINSYHPNYTLFHNGKQQSHNISAEINCAIIILYLCDIFISIIIWHPIHIQFNQMNNHLWYETILSNHLW